VGLVEKHSNKSGDAERFRKLASALPTRKVGEEPRSNVTRVLKRLSQDDTAKFVEAYQNGHNVREMARQLGVHRSTLHELVRRRGLKRGTVTMPAENVAIAEAYRVGATLAELGVRYGMGLNRVHTEVVVVPTSAAIREFATPSDASNTIRARCASPARIAVDLVHCLNSTSSPSKSRNAGAGEFAITNSPKPSTI
jgi:transposase-like protein